MAGRFVKGQGGPGEAQDGEAGARARASLRAA